MQQIEPLTNYYDILEISPRASTQEIHQAYANIKKAYSLRNPDIFRNFSFDELQQLLILIEEAYSTVGNQETRQIYDARLFETYPHLKEVKPEPAIVAEEKTVEAEPDRSTLPIGYAKTSLSVYEIDDAFETLIQNQEFFDGVLLGKIRKYKRVKLEEFSKFTCISIKYLYAIEDNNYSALPAPVFVRGYIHQYCKILELDTDRVTNSFMKLYTNGRD